jgi:hypothetical protein
VPEAITNLEIQAVQPGPAATMPQTAAASLLPKAIQQLSGGDRLRALEMSPRLRIGWKTERERGTFLAIIKDRKRWTSAGSKSRSDGSEPFEAVLTRLAGLRIQDKISPADLARPELFEWLQGKRDVGLPTDLADFFIPADGRELEVTGLSASAQTAPWFVDYFHDLRSGETPASAVMEYDHRYSYKVAAYREIEPAPGSSIARRLYSDFTPFSPFVPAAIPEWAIAPLTAPLVQEVSTLLPTLAFALKIADIRPSLGLKTRLGFHVVIVRDLGDHFAPLGRPTLLLTGTTGSGIIDAGEILRPGRLDPVQLVYRLQIGSFLIDEAGNREPLDELIVKDLVITIPPPAGHEKAVRQDITITLGGP